MATLLGVLAGVLFGYWLFFGMIRPVTGRPWLIKGWRVVLLPLAVVVLGYTAIQL